MRKKGFPKVAAFLKASAQSARKLGAPEQFADVTPVSVATPVETPTPKTLSKDKLILPETQMPQYVSEVLQRAEEAGIGVFEPYHLSGITLTRELRVEGWKKKPEDWYWK